MTVLAAPVTLEDHAEGPLNAKVALVEYGDYACPFTRIARHSVGELRLALSDRLLFVFRHFPRVTVHAQARSAASAAEAAAGQGRFWAMHEYLFKHQSSLGPTDLLRYAVELRLDPDRFDHDRSSAEIDRRIERDLTSGRASGVQATPTFYVNGLRHQGSFQVESLRLRIDAEFQGLEREF
jgi:protein-disulfide isomerase